MAACLVRPGRDLRDRGALKRIEIGTFGVCELTSKNIPRARLEAIPWTRFTVEAQAQLEREGALRQKRLAALGSMESTAAADMIHPHFAGTQRSC